MRRSPFAAATVVTAIALALPVLPALGQPGQQLQGASSIETSIGPVKTEVLASGLEHPWGMAFLPDGRMLVTERAGRLRLLDPDTGRLSDPIEGTPEVFAEGQGGLLDVALHPDFQRNRLVYLSFAEPGDDGTAGTALGRGRLAVQNGSARIEDFETIFRQEPKVEGPNHFGSRIVFGSDGTLFLTLAERFKFDPAQDPTNHLGTIVRLNLDGSVPDDNPFVDDPDALAEIWSYEHRNIQSAAIDPATGKLWVAEMGPLGGDELNQPAAGRNYGWPVVSWGRHYNGEDIPDPPTHPEFADAVIHWTPVISPSGMVFYGGDLFPDWQGSALIGALSGTAVVRVGIRGEQAEELERIPLGDRIRDVAEGPDGAIYVVTDRKDGGVWRLTPMEEAVERE